MSFPSVISLFLILLLLAAIPSASVALVVARSAVLGVRNGIAVSAGIVLGDLVFATLAILGMSFLAETMGAFFAVLRYLGGAYLIWLGIGLLRSKVRIETEQPELRPSSLATSFLAGFFLTLGDLKAILFYASLFPGVIELERLGWLGIGVILGVTVLAVGSVKVFYAVAARSIVQRIRGYGDDRRTTRVAGGLMVASGAYVIAKS